MYIVIYFIKILLKICHQNPLSKTAMACFLTHGSYTKQLTKGGKCYDIRHHNQTQMATILSEWHYQHAYQGKWQSSVRGETKRVHDCTYTVLEWLHQHAVWGRGQNCFQHKIKTYSPYLWRPSLIFKPGGITILSVYLYKSWLACPS